MKNTPVHRPQPSWRAPRGRVVRPEGWCLAAAVVGLLLLEVRQSTRMTERAVALDQSRTELQQARARLDFVGAELEHRSTRAELAPLALKLGLAPPEPQQVVVLPAEYLADADERRPREAVSLAAWAERASRVLVPEARARVRTGG